jgi:RimJ/RimL family protein N-acetyltransferase
MGLDEKDGRREYSVRLLQKFGKVDPYLTPQKIQELWIECSQHDTLFSDYTRGKVEPFLDVLFANNAVQAEIYSIDDETPIGSAMMNRVLPNFDALAHFTIWNGRARGKEPLFLEMMRMWMSEFNLRRLSTEVTGHSKGLIRMINRLGFRHEGTRREGSIHKGAWIDLEMYGILESELQEKLQEA